MYMNVITFSLLLCNCIYIQYVNMCHCMYNMYMSVIVCTVCTQVLFVCVVEYTQSDLFAIELYNNYETVSLK